MGSSVQDCFSDISLNIMQFLEDHPAVSRVRLHERPPATQTAISEWHKQNAPYTLPNDLLAFLQISDGLLLRWDAKYWGAPGDGGSSSGNGQSTLPLGCMHVNSVNALNEVPLGLDMPVLQPPGESWITHVEKKTDQLASKKGCGFGKGAAAKNKENWKAFDLDSTCLNGRVVLLYAADFAHPQVWFQDLSCAWSFIAGSFKDYFRLLIIHLGLPHWHYVFTDTGLDTASMQWFRFMCPERLNIDLGHRERSLKVGGGGVSNAASGVVKGAQEHRKRKEVDLDSIDRSASRKASGLASAAAKPSGTEDRRPPTAPNQLTSSSRGRTPSFSGRNRPSSLASAAARQAGRR